MRYTEFYGTHMFFASNLQFTVKFNIFGKKYCVSKQAGYFMENTYKKKRPVSLKRLVLLILTNFNIDLF